MGQFENGRHSNGRLAFGLNGQLGFGDYGFGQIVSEKYTDWKCGFGRDDAFGRFDFKGKGSKHELFGEVVEVGEFEGVGGTHVDGKEAEVEFGWDLAEDQSFLTGKSIRFVHLTLKGT